MRVFASYSLHSLINQGVFMRHFNESCLKDDSDKELLLLFFLSRLWKHKMKHGLPESGLEIQP